MQLTRLSQPPWCSKPITTNRPGIALVFVCTLLLFGCGQTTETESTTSTSGELPPGFMDEPPPPPVSDTLVLSGGTLMMGEEISDSVVVIKDGKLLAWGKRGEVSMPNDSIGYDMRGKWLMPLGGVPSIGDSASFDVMIAAPEQEVSGGVTLANIGQVDGNELRIEDDVD